MTKRETKKGLYSGSGERGFERRYGKSKGKRVWGAVVGKVRREEIADGKLPRKHTFESKKAALNLAKELRRKGRDAHVTVKGIVRKKYTVHAE